MTSLETLEGLWKARPGGLAFAVFAEGLHLSGRDDEAAGIVAEGVRRWPRHLGGRLVQGRIALDRGDVETARNVFQVAVDLDSSCRAALEGLAEASGRGQYFKQALDAWSRLSALEPEHPRAKEEMRNAARKLDAPTGMDAVAMVREEEDDRSREALSEGTTSHASGIAQATSLAFGMDLGAGTAPSEFGPGLLESPSAHFGVPTIPELPGFQIPSSPTASSQNLLGRAGESSFATLEMPSFPSKTIPPPPLDPPEAQIPPAVTSLPEQPPSTPRFPAPEDRQEAEATQFFATQSPLDETKGRSRVTGEDIENRLDEVFGHSTPAPPTPSPATTPDSSAGASSGGQVTGRDVEDRLGELFGESSHPPAAPVPPHATASGSAELHAEPPTVESVPVFANGPVVSGDDIEGRLDDLFGESVIDLTSPASAAPGTGEDTSAMPKEDILPAELLKRGSDTAALGRDTAFEARPTALPRGGESTAEMNARDLDLGATQYLDQAIKGSEIDTAGSTIDLPTIDVGHSETGRNTRLTAEDVDSRLDELFASSEFLAEPPQTSGRTGFVPKADAAPPGPVTGDDIEGRLDDLFGGDSDFPASLPTVTFAEEYFRQGHRDKAASIYRQLLEKDPANAELRRRLSEIEGRA
jgi:hypothetical protein